MIGIVAILLGVGAYSYTRSRRRVSVERAAVEIRARLHKVQSLAAVAGSQLGAKRGTERLRYEGCPTVNNSFQLWIRVDTDQRIILPADLQYDPAADQVVVRCETLDLNVITNGLARFTFPPAGTQLAFTPSGRLVLVGPVAPLYFELQGDNNDRFGFRILQSGVTCEASQDTTPPLCNEDLG